jgi:hypothetical protein
MSTLLVSKPFKMRQRTPNVPIPASRGTAAAATRSAEPGTIAMCFVASALQSVRDRNLDADDLLANVGLSPSLLQVPQARFQRRYTVPCGAQSRWPSMMNSSARIPAA